MGNRNKRNNRNNRSKRSQRNSRSRRCKSDNRSTALASPSSTPRVYVMSLTDPNSQSQLVTPDYIVQPGDRFLHDVDFLDRASKRKLDTLRGMKEQLRLQQIQQEIAELGEYAEDGHGTNLLPEADAEFVNEWLRRILPGRYGTRRLQLSKMTSLADAVAIYALALQHRGAERRLNGIAKRLLKGIASGLTTCAYFQDFDLRHGYDGEYH